MKTKKKGIIFISAILVVTAVLLAAFSSKIINGIANHQASEFTSADLKNVDNIVLLSRCIKIGEQENSVAGVKEAVRLGADAVAVDVCFKQDGTPVMSDSYENIGSAPLLEDLFKALGDKKFADTKIFLNIVQLSELSVLNQLAVDYNLVSRLIIIGIDTAHYGLITGDDTIIPFYLDYEFTSEELSDISDGKFSVPDVIEKYGASGLSIKLSDCKTDVADTLDGYGIPFIVSAAGNNKELAQTLTANAGTVLVEDIESSRIFLDGWIKEMQNRYESSVEKSLKELSSAAKK